MFTHFGCGYQGKYHVEHKTRNLFTIYDLKTKSHYDVQSKVCVYKLILIGKKDWQKLRGKEKEREGKKRRTKEEKENSKYSAFLQQLFKQALKVKGVLVL